MTSSHSRRRLAPSWQRISLAILALLRPTKRALSLRSNRSAQKLSILLSPSMQSKSLAEQPSRNRGLLAMSANGMDRLLPPERSA